MSQPLYIPEAGDRITLAAPWAVHIDWDWGYRKYDADQVFPAGTPFTVERIYTQRGRGYTAIALRILKGDWPGYPERYARFSVPLSKVNGKMVIT